MTSLEEIRKKKLEEFQRQQQAASQENIQEELAIQQQLAQLEDVVKSRMTKDAIERYGNLKSAHPEKATNVIIIIGQAIQRGQVNTINDGMLREILMELNPKKKDFKIRRI